MAEPDVLDDVAGAGDETPDPGAALLGLAENLAATHREHEKHYGEAPLSGAAALLRWSRTLKALAERWTTAEPAALPLPSPLAGADDLNDPRAVENSGFLFLEGDTPPAELSILMGDLERTAADAESAGTYLSKAMDASWQMAAGLLGFPELDDLVAERHGIIARDSQAASLLLLEARQLRRAAEILGHVDFAPSALRRDLAADRRAPRLLFAAAELIDAAANSCLDSAALVRQNERTWRLFGDRVAQAAKSRNRAHL